MAFRRMPAHSLRGVPDILLVLPVGGIPILCGIEVKTPTGRLSEYQKDFQERLGYTYTVMSSVDDIEKFITRVYATTKEKMSHVR